MWNTVQSQPEIADGSVDEVLARLADAMTRSLVSAIDIFDERVEELTELALEADGRFLREVSRARAELATVRRSVHPQRETLDLLQHSGSPAVSPAGQRRFSDAFDVAARAAAGMDAARTALTETLDAYRGAEARKATEVTKVLTVYAAIMLPLTLLVGFFGMNFTNLPGATNESAWIVVTVSMVVGTVVALGVFVSLGWIRRPAGRDLGAILSRGLVEAGHTIAQLLRAVVEVLLLPIRAIAAVTRDVEGGTDRPRR